MPEDLRNLFAEEQAVYGTRDHQRTISRLTTGLGMLYYHEKTIALEPMPETMLNENEASPVPDVILVDNETSAIPVIIEVCNTGGLKRDLKKIISLVDSDDYGIREAFVYDYRTERWIRYGFGSEGETIESSYSEILRLDLNKFL